jgi:hypothetical protein
MDEPDPTKRRGLWSKASRLWSEVVAKGNAAQNNKEAVSSFLYAANELYTRGDSQRAVEAVYEAQGFATGDKELEQHVRDWQDALGRSQ